MQSERRSRAEYPPWAQLRYRADELPARAESGKALRGSRTGANHRRQASVRRRSPHTRRARSGPGWPVSSPRQRHSRGSHRQARQPSACNGLLVSPAGDTKAEAIRALSRRIPDEVYRRLWQDELRITSAEAGHEVAA
jgi:hypothetical protein